MDALIFVALALGWAVYLIPQALRRHDDDARHRPVERISERMRVLGKVGRQSATPVASEPTAAESTAAEPAELIAEPGVRTYRVTREAAAKAAKRRRRVLVILAIITAAVGGASFAGYLPPWSAAVPGGLIVLFLVVARFTVRAQLAPAAGPAAPAAPVEPVTAVEQATAEDVEVDLGNEDTVAVSRVDLAAASGAAALLADDGGLWDPLPMTLPTYVNKPHAERTVRTIELTGMVSSGHDAHASSLAREADAAQRAAREAEADAVAADAARRAAGA